MMGEYDFPDTGPISIFDLGVPHDVEIVSRVAEANRFSTETQQILEAGERAARNFPQQYRALVWSDQEHGEIDVFYRSGERLHYFHYFNLDGDDYPECHLDLPTTTTEILHWTDNQTPVSLGIFADANIFRRFNVHPCIDINDRTWVRVFRAAERKSLPFRFYLEDDFWPYVYRKGLFLGNDW